MGAIEINAVLFGIRINTLIAHKKLVSNITLMY